jgi:hypothetical protein
MDHLNASRNLLFGILAVQMHFGWRHEPKPLPRTRLRSSTTRYPLVTPPLFPGR